MLTSFGIAQDAKLPEAETESWLRGRFSDHYLHHADFPHANLGHDHHGHEGTLFRRMPPIDMRDASRIFMPDYAALLVSDTLVLDKTTFEALQEAPHPAYTLVADTMDALKAEGLLQVVDYDEILCRRAALLTTMVDRDMNALESWVEPLRESIEIWHEFTSKFQSGTPVGGQFSRFAAEIYHAARGQAFGLSDMIWQALASSRLRRKAIYRGALRWVLRSYLLYVNANLILSREIGAGFHDWADYRPFYQRKFMSVGQTEIPGEAQASALRQLFTVSFPEFAIGDTPTLLRAIRDGRIASLRRLVQDAVEGKVAFDAEFANGVLKEVLASERAATRHRKIVSYVTLPMHLIPFVGVAVHKAAEEVAGKAIEHKLREKHRWFYLLSDVAESPD